jgi:predicted oxidoreductase
VSNFTPSQFAMLHAEIPLVTNQVELHPLQRHVLHDGTLDQAISLRLRPMIWSPLAGGRLFTGQTPDAIRVRAELEAIAASRGVSVATVAFAWVLAHPSRPYPITGSGRVDVLREAVAALDVQLTRDEWYRIWEAGHGAPVA